MEDHVRKRHPTQRHPQIRHVRKVGLRRFAWFVTLDEHHLLLRPVQRSPQLHVTLQRPHLPFLVAARVLAAQLTEQRHPLQRRVPLQLLLHPGPILGEWIGPRAVVPPLPHLAGQLPQPLILAGRPLTHPRPGGGDRLAIPLLPFALQQSYLGIFLHDALSFSMRAPCSGHGQGLSPQP